MFRRDAIYRFSLRRSAKIEPVTIGSAAVVIAALSGAPLPGAIWSAPCTALSSGYPARISRRKIESVSEAATIFDTSRNSLALAPNGAVATPT